MSTDLFSDFDEVSPVAASFNRAALRYRQHARVQQEMAAWLAAWLPADRKGRALEIGAGPGLFTERLVPWPGTLLVSDISPAMCAAGRAAVPQTTWTIMSAEALEGSGWDWMFCSSMLQWTARPAQVLARWRERLSPGGRILAGLYVDETLPELRSVVEMRGPVEWRTVDTWRADIVKAGLTPIRDTVERRVFQYGSALELWRSLHAVGAAPGRRISPGQLRRWLRTYEERFRSEAGVRTTWTFYRFEASRAV